MRNRDIQRRSRARRKEYIEDLEKRIRQYERDGIKVTAEVQAAARKVAEENCLLRSLLEKHGIPTAQIKECLHNGGVAGSILSEAAKVPVKNALPQVHVGYTSPQLPAQVVQSSPSPPTSTTAHRAGDLDLSSPSLLASTIGHKAGGSILNRPKDKDIVYTIEESLRDNDAHPSRMAKEASVGCSYFDGRIEPCSPCRAYECEDAAKRVDETSCEDAARIIASMRGHRDPEGVWPELGCSARESCMVKNITIFQMIDER